MILISKSQAKIQSTSQIIFISSQVVKKIQSFLINMDACFISVIFHTEYESGDIVVIYIHNNIIQFC
jgi:hypothetical protein